MAQRTLASGAWCKGRAKVCAALYLASPSSQRHQIFPNPGAPASARPVRCAKRSSKSALAASKASPDSTGTFSLRSGVRPDIMNEDLHTNVIDRITAHIDIIFILHTR